MLFLMFCYFSLYILSHNNQSPSPLHFVFLFALTKLCIVSKNIVISLKAKVLNTKNAWKKQSRISFSWSALEPNLVFSALCWQNLGFSFRQSAHKLFDERLSRKFDQMDMIGIASEKQTAEMDADMWQYSLPRTWSFLFCYMLSLFFFV